MRHIRSTIVRAVAVAALPLLVAGCSSAEPDEQEKGNGAGSGGSASASAKPSLAPARFTELPAPCKVLAEKTVKDLVPKTKDVSGSPGRSSDTNARASCHWNGLNGFQYRWLEVSFERTDTVEGIGSAEDQAKAAYARLKAEAAVPEGLKKGETPAIRVVPDLGDESQLVSATVRQDGDDYREVTVVARTSNVVVTVGYEGTGFEGSKLPKAKEIEDGAVKAAKEALAAFK